MPKCPRISSNSLLNSSLTSPLTTSFTFLSSSSLSFSTLVVYAFTSFISSSLFFRVLEASSVAFLSCSSYCIYAVAANLRNSLSLSFSNSSRWEANSSYSFYSLVWKPPGTILYPRYSSIFYWSVNNWLIVPASESIYLFTAEISY